SKCWQVQFARRAGPRGRLGGIASVAIFLFPYSGSRSTNVGVFSRFPPASFPPQATLNPALSENFDPALFRRPSEGLRAPSCRVHSPWQGPPAARPALAGAE